MKRILNRLTNLLKQKTEKEKRMAQVQVQVAGGSIQQKSADTVGELAQAVDAGGYVATVNGEPQDADYELTDFEFVSFAKPVKAG